MEFEESLRLGYVRKILADKFRAKNLFNSSKQAIETAKNISLHENSAKTILREIYEGFREYCESIGYLKGYKFLSHESISYFIRDVLKNKEIAEKFERYRKIRNGINYYGEDVNIETVKEALKEIPELIKELQKFKD